MRARQIRPAVLGPWLAAILGLAGCAYPPTSQTPPQCMVSEQDLLGQIDARGLALLLSEGLCPVPDDTAPEGDAGTLVVADPVDVQNYLPGHLGRAFGDVFRSAVYQRCKLPIQQVELSRDFSLTPNGITALTRDLRNVRGEFRARVALVTTYSLTRNRVYFVARRLDVATGAITAMSTREVSWQCDKNLMGDSRLQTLIR
jgi:hypothetical protein